MQTDKQVALPTGTAICIPNPVQRHIIHAIQFVMRRRYRYGGQSGDMHAVAHACSQPFMHACVHACMHACMDWCRRPCSCTRWRTPVVIATLSDTPTDRSVDRSADRQPYRQSYRHARMQTDIMCTHLPNQQTDNPVLRAIYICNSDRETHPLAHTYMHASVHTCMHTSMHRYTLKSCGTALYSG